VKPRVAITLGDPAGIGPEIAVAAARARRVLSVCEPLLVGHRLPRIPLGRPSKAAGLAAIAALQEGVALIQAGQAQALVTAPVSKESFALADYGFPGHTEWLAQQSGIKEYGMLMVADHLRALLVTRHIPLSQVPEKLNRDSIAVAARLGFNFVRDLLKKKNPRLVLCGLNPHAGDHGLLGTEEDRLLRPVLKTLKRQGLAITGPIAADAAFRDMARGAYDMALACYHDQGMIPLKVFASERMVNITLGLPYIRTSPAHGTAYDIAGKKKAKTGPMIEAILLAAKYGGRAQSQTPTRKANTEKPNRKTRDS